MHRLARVAVALSALAGVAALALACGTDAVGVDECRQIESARCLQAPNCAAYCTASTTACPIDLAIPVHRDAPTTDIDACVRYYHDACLHGLKTSTLPDTAQLNGCLAAINSGYCPTVIQPETDPACAWLIPPQTPDAGVADTSTADTSTTDTGTTTSTFQCPGGCADYGVNGASCGQAHECDCSAALGNAPISCQLAGSNTQGAIVYCCLAN
jgi:hypothetical protein